MIRTTILIPKNFNDGKQVPFSSIKAFNKVFLTNFGGYTIEGTVDGAYVGKENRVYIDKLLKYVIAVNEEDFGKLREVAAYIREALDQESVYLEIGTQIEFI